MIKISTFVVAGGYGHVCLYEVALWEPSTNEIERNRLKSHGG